MCTDEQHAEKMAKLDHLIECLEYVGPEDKQISISDTIPWTVNYQGRRHIFLFSATTLTLVLQDYGQLTLTQNTWVNLGIRPGTQVVTTGQATPVTVLVRATNEVIP